MAEGSLLPPTTKPAGTTELTVPDDPDGSKMAALIDAASVPFATLAQIAYRSGLPEDVVRALVPELKARGMLADLKKVKHSELVELIEDRAFRALASMSDEDFLKAGIKDKAITTGILLEKRQLLRGEPTAILSIEDRMALNKLIPRLVREAERRGLSVDAKFTEDESGKAVSVDIGPPPTERAIRPRTGSAKSWNEMAKAKEIEATAEDGEPSE